MAEFHLAGAPPRKQCWWLVFESEAVGLCCRHPGFAVDLRVETSLRALAQIWIGHLGLDQALREERLRLDGARGEVTAFRSWFLLSTLAPAGREPAPPGLSSPLAP